ncbi:MAG: sulfatase-like hydrolase/transferase, partial [Acidobacteriaceae bacterium]|nr:sulfatase-like hydrolase/transferase [Acidobacteriaceae bacterium]
MSAAFAVYFSWRFTPWGLSPLDYRFQLFHVSLVVAALFASGIVIGIMVRASWLRHRWRRSVGAGLCGLAAVLLVLLYAANITSNTLWQENISADMIADYGPWVVGIGNDAPPLSPGIYLCLAIGVAGVVALFVAWSDRFTCAFESLVYPGGRYSLFSTPRRTRVSVAALCLCAAGLGVTLTVLARQLRAEGVLHRDPVVALFRPQKEKAQFGWYVAFENQQKRVASEREAYRQLHQAADRNVIIVIADSLRADHMGVYGYELPTTPFLSRLADEGRLLKVDRAFSACSVSPCGILSTMSGRLIAGVEFGYKIFDLLHDVGYQSYFVLGGRHDWLGLRSAYGYEQALYLDGADAAPYDSNDDRAVLAGLDRLPANEHDRSFFYIHLMSTHFVGTRWPEFARFTPNDVRIGWFGAVSADDRQKWVNHYDNGVLQADAIIERLFAKLDALGYLRNSMVVILADHGDALGERGASSYLHGDLFYQEAVHIPLLIYDDPGVTYRNLQFASQIDVAPTIASRLHLKVPDAWTGMSLLDPPADR